MEGAAACGSYEVEAVAGRVAVSDEEVSRMMDIDLEIYPPGPSPPRQSQAQPRMVGTAESIHPMTALSSRLVDLKGVAKPPTWDGREQAYQEWKFRFESVMALLDLEVGMKQAVDTGGQEALDTLSSMERGRSKLLYNILVQVVSGKALSLVRLGEIFMGTRRGPASCRPTNQMWV